MRPFHPRLVCATVLSAWLALPTFAHAAEPPVARTVDTVDHVFGHDLPDPYRWMEGADNPEFKAWLAAQGESARTQLDALPTLKPWRQALDKVSGASVIHRMQRSVAGRLFFIRQSAQGSGTLMVREADGRERVLLDPATLDGAGGHASITLHAPSPDGSKVAVNIDRGGSEVTRLEVLDVASGKPTGDAVEPVWGEFAAYWLADGSGFAYTQVAPPEQRTDGDLLQDMRLRVHRLGTPAAQDSLLLRAGSGEGVNPSLAIASNRFPAIQFSAGTRWALATVSGAQPEIRVCMAPQAEVVKPGVRWTCIADFDDRVQTVDVHGDTLYLVSTRAHSNGRLLALDLSQPNPSLKDARDILPLADDELLAGTSLADTGTVSAARDALYVKVSKGGIDGVRRIDYASGKVETIAMPFAGSAALFRTNVAEDGFLLTLRGWTTPSASWRYDPKARALQSLEQDEASPGDYGMIVATETDMASADGTRVPLTILHRKDMPLDGSRRAIVFGYGGYGMSLTPAFRPIRLEWVKQGNVFAIAHVRGGGEKGEDWHRAGKGANKHKGVEDFVASVQRLSELGYSRPQRTALLSGSMGGVLIGGALVRYPDRFGAAVPLVGIFNPVRILHAINGANQLGELGDPRQRDDFDAILAMDPYQHVRPKTAYPAVMFGVGLNDSRVSTWETGKFAARLRAANTSGRANWIRTDGNAGHGLQASLGTEAAQYADIYAFLDAQLPVPE